jgi:hypothetical protein
MIPFVFLKASNNVKLSKTYTNGETTAYPSVRKFDSRRVNIPFNNRIINKLKVELKRASARGECLLKGISLKDIKQQRRIGLCNKHTPTQHICIDIDGYQKEGLDVRKERLSEDRIKEIAEETIEDLLPDYMQNVSYVFGVSSSFGIKPTVNIHYHFILDEPVNPKDLRNWLTSLNFIKNNQKLLTLNTQKQSLKYLIDPAPASNSQLIYIAKPEFNGTSKNPIRNKEHRIQEVNKDKFSFSLKKHLNEFDIEGLKAKTKQTINKLRADLGLPKIKSTYFIGRDNEGYEIKYLGNPPKMRIQHTYTDGEYAHFNVNDGDSNGYWCLVADPKIMFNFKNEPPFAFETADKEAFNNFVEKHKHLMPERNRFMVIHDVERDIYLKVTYREKDNKIVSIYQSKKESCKDWLASKGELEPEIYEPWTTGFDPSKPPGVDWDRRNINTFNPTEYMLTKSRLPKEIKDGLTYGYGSRLAGLCPLIHDIIFHALGSEVVTFEHFINWLAFVFQTKDKAKTAWILQGVQGTGKGMLFEYILSPLFNHPDSVQHHPVAIEKTMANFDDQFNSYIENNLIMVVDEFNINNSKNKDAENFFKNAITEPIQTIRTMRANPITRRTFSNFIFNTNESDSAKIDASDRRYNVGDYQRIKLEAVIPNLYEREIEKEIKSELKNFASFLNQFQVNQSAVKRPLANTAKAKLREVSTESYQLLMMKFIEGDLNKFTEIVETVPATEIEQARYEHVRRTIIKWLMLANTNKECATKKDELRMVFEYFSNKNLPRKSFNAMMLKANIEEKRTTFDGERTRYIINKWFCDEEIRQELLARHAGELEITKFSKMGINVEPIKILKQQMTQEPNIANL